MKTFDVTYSYWFIDSITETESEPVYKKDASIKASDWDVAIRVAKILVNQDPDMAWADRWEEWTEQRVVRTNGKGRNPRAINIATQQSHIIDNQQAGIEVRLAGNRVGTPVHYA